MIWFLLYLFRYIVHFQAIRDVLLVGHRQAFAWIDQWFGEFNIFYNAFRINHFIHKNISY